MINFLQSVDKISTPRRDRSIGNLQLHIHLFFNLCKKVWMTHKFSQKLLHCLSFRGHRGSIWSLVSRGHRLFSAGGDQVIKVWNMENVRLAKCTEVLEGHSNDVS